MLPAESIFPAVCFQCKYKARNPTILLSSSPNKLNKLTKMAVAMSPRTFREASFFFIRPLNHSWFILIFYKNNNHSTIAGSFSFFIRTPSVHLLINLYCVLEAYICQSTVNPKWSSDQCKFVQAEC